MDYDEARGEALARLADDDPQGAFSAFRWAVEYPAELADAQWPEALDILARITRAIAGDELAGLVSAVAKRPDDVQTLYDAAYALYEQRLFGIAATLLSRANQLAPGEPTIVTELSANLEELTQNGAAAAVLRASGLADTDPMCRYLLAFNCLMSGDLDEPRALLPKLTATEDEQIQFVTGALRGMLERADVLADVCTLDDTDLTGWHMVINAGVLLHESPHGFEEAMRGRYAYVGDSYGLIREGIQRVGELLDAGNIEVERVIALPDRSSAIVAEAAAIGLGVPCVPYQRQESRPGLLVAYDLDRVGDAEVLEHLHSHRPGQILWAHASAWVNPFPFTPDLTTLLYQSCASPWDGEAMHVDPDTRQVTSMPPDESPPAQIAAEIAEASISDASHSSMDLLRSMVAAVSRVAEDSTAGMFRATGHRCRQRNGSPVQSNRFV